MVNKSEGQSSPLFNIALRHVAELAIILLLIIGVGCDDYHPTPYCIPIELTDDPEICLGQTTYMLDTNKEIAKPNSYGPFYKEERSARFFNEFSYYPKYGHVVKVSLLNAGMPLSDWEVLEQLCREYFGDHPVVEETKDARSYSQLFHWEFQPQVTANLYLMRLTTDSASVCLAFLIIGYTSEVEESSSSDSAVNLDAETSDSFRRYLVVSEYLRSRERDGS